MQAFERLLEAVEFSRDIDSSWIDQFSDILEARSVLSKAEKQTTDEYEIARLSIAMDGEPPDTLEDVERVRKKCFLRLRRMLIDNR